MLFRLSRRSSGQRRDNGAPAEEPAAEYETYTQTKKYIEEVARDKLGLVYEGEILFKDEN